jgi:hypothetical protein
MTDLPADAEASFLFRLSLGGLRPRRARLRFTGKMWALSWVFSRFRCPCRL